MKQHNILTLTISTREALFAAIKTGAILITPNNRLSNQLLQDYFKHLQTKQPTTKPSCLPYQAFLNDQYKKARQLYAHLVHPILLTSAQQIYLWQQILNQHEPCNEGLLTEIQEAWARCQHWQIDCSQAIFAQTPQTRQFQLWQQQLQENLTTLNAITEEQLATHLLNYPDLFAMPPLIWACFDDFTPQQLALQQAIDAAGGKQYHYDLTPQANSSYQYAAKDAQQERLLMIQWLKQKLNLGEQRIAVVVPDLQTQSQQLQRLLQRHIPTHLFNISLGQSLIDYPLVAHALQWLNLNKQTISDYQIRLLLHSPYLAGSQTESKARMDLMQNRSLLQEPISAYKTFIETLNNSAPQLAALLQNRPDYPTQASPKIWAELFKTQLIYFGFPGEYTLSSSAYQCFQRFMMLFEEFVQFSTITPLMQQEQALQTLTDLAKSIIFQPQTATTPIQVLGLLEASGNTFDSIWVSGLTDQCLPQKTRLSAFIPLDLQREQLMPHATPLRELQFAKQLVQRLQNGSQDSVFSYPELSGDSPNLPSPMIKHLPKLNINPLPDFLVQSNTVKHEENYILPLLSEEPITGGTALLANQAKCPFRAFAVHRLQAKSALTVIDGPDMGERGQLIHKIMELLWQRLGSQQQLLSLTQTELQTQIKEVIQHALDPLVNEHRYSFPLLMQEVELSRLHEMVNACLEWEKQRPPFTVEALEKEFIIQLADMNFRVRIDRLDNVGDKKWVIDYKSSLPTNKPWNEERPEAPQLLLYALLNESINTLLFLQLKAGHISCSGLSEDILALRGVSSLKKGEDWLERQAQWQQQLTQLAAEFRNGYCAPKPHRATTCQQCEFPNLCRVGQ